MQLENLKTDYIDYGFIHCIDEEKDWQKYQDGGILQYLLDMLMFSINAAYDHAKGDYANGSSSERMDLYRRCEKEGVGISVMKPFSGGQLLDEAHDYSVLGELTPRAEQPACVYCNHCAPCPMGLNVALPV